MRHLAWLLLGVLSLTSGFAQPLRLVRTIPLPGVQGRIDHLAFDGAGQRLFVAALGNNTVEVVDLAGGKVVSSLSGLSEPQGVLYLPALDQLTVANGGDGRLRVFGGADLAPVTTLQLEDDADNVRYDPRTKRLFVGCGSGALVAVDPVKHVQVASIPLPSHPESFQLEQEGTRIYVNLPGAHEIAVADAAKGRVIEHWSLGMVAGNYPMALDEAHHRLFVGCRVPSRLLVFDTASGKEIARLDLHGDCDDLFYDSVRRQIYAACGEGYIDVFTQSNPDHYVLKAAVKSSPGARTALVVGDRLFLAVPKRSGHAAEIQEFGLE